jgi:hypothetical protein
MLLLPLAFVALFSARASLASRALPFAIADKEPPKVVSLEPEDQSDEVDAKKTTKLIVTFDRPMVDSAWSFCGGGPDFPTFKGKPHWDTPKKCVVDVELVPEHEYLLRLNCPPSGTNFRTPEGVQLVPVAWSFSTLPEKLPNPAKQHSDNRAAFDALKKLLPETYSYYDLRVRSWDKLFAANESSILGAKTTRGWARRVAKMLAPTEDIHMHLEAGGHAFGVGSRSVDPLFRSKLVSNYLPTQSAGGGLQGRTQDGIGYLMIPNWTDAHDVDAIERALATMRDCKAMIVDVRPNAGGDELLARRIAAWFVDGFMVYGKHRFRVRAGKEGFDPIVDRAIEGNKDAQRRISVPIAVLTSRYVMSSNESFVLMMKQAKDCMVVGQKTYGSSGNPRPHPLPNDVTIFVPSWQDLRLDGTCFEGEGLAPDIEVKVEPKDLEVKDPILEKALALLRDKLKS